MRGLLVATVGLAALLVGCAGSDDPVTSAPTSPASESASKPSPSPTASAVAKWESMYSERELAVYREAVQRVDAFDAKVRPIWAAGEATRGAKELFQDNLLTWRTSWGQLQTADERRIKIARGPTVLWTRPALVKFLGGGAVEVRLVRCTDQSDLGATMNGEPLSEASADPVIQKIDTYRYRDGRWRIGMYNTLDKTCGA